jgi:hypothetical protein
LSRHKAGEPVIECVCFWVDEKYWFTHYGATEPGSQKEPNPECAVHFPKWFVSKDREAGSWVAEHPVFGRHAVMGSHRRAFDIAFGAATKQMEGR